MPGDGPAQGGLEGAARALEEAASIRDGACAASPESMPVAGIVGAYYAALAARAHAEAAELSAEKPGGGDAAAASSALASSALAAFDSGFHPRALARLEGLADGIARGLESAEGGAGAGAGAAAEYDRLREAMSAAEFARQYDRGLRGG